MLALTEVIHNVNMMHLLFTKTSLAQKRNNKQKLVKNVKARRLNINGASFFCSACEQIMDKFVKALPGKHEAQSKESTPNVTTTEKKKQENMTT